MGDAGVKTAPMRLELELQADLRLERAHAITPLGPMDPSCRVAPGCVEWAGHTPEGPVTLRLRQAPKDLARGLAELWGPGASWLEPHLPAFAGQLDAPDRFVPEPGPIADLWRRFAGMYLPQLPVASPTLWQVVLLQLVRSNDAVRSWRKLVARLGTPAPGPLGLHLPPDPQTMASTPLHDVVALGVLPKQGRTLQRVAREAKRIERARTQGWPALERRLRSIRGIGPWTMGYVRGVVCGDPDAVLPGDYGLPSRARFIFEGEHEGEDADLFRLLAPFEGHRWRVIRLMWASGSKPPRQAPRMARAHRPGHGWRRPR